MRIDVHCHVFNSSDLPIEGFVRNIILNTDETLSLGEYDSLVSLVCRLLDSAPDAKDEGELLKTHGQRLSVDSVDEGKLTPDSDFDERLGKELERLKNAKGPSERDLFRRIQLESSFAARSLGTESVAERYGNLDLLKTDSGTIKRFSEWAATMVLPRHKIIDKIIKLYGNQGEVELFTPALIDYSKWLNCEPRTPILSQIDLFSELIALFPGRMHPFVAFDPLRAALGQSDDDPLQWVKDAIGYTKANGEKVIGKGFVGVKLYPPMGFRAYGNSDLYFIYGDKRAGVQIGKELDAVLDELYAWAEAEEVPIMAHCGATNEAKCGYGERANPKYWQLVLEKYNKLRLNLGHFGSGSMTEEGRRWDEEICMLMGDDRFPYVYADLGYYASILKQGGEASLVAQLDRLTEKFPTVPLFDRLMYASDWVMLGTEEDAALYYKRFNQAIADYDRQREPTDRLEHRFFGYNAEAFLGLGIMRGTGSKTKERLQEFYTSKGIPHPHWLHDTWPNFDKNFDLAHDFKTRLIDAGFHATIVPLDHPSDASQSLTCGFFSYDRERDEYRFSVKVQKNGREGVLRATIPQKEDGSAVTIVGLSKEGSVRISPDDVLSLADTISQLVFD